MKRLLAVALIIFPLAGNAANLEGYAEKCAELIEQSKSPASNWTTSLREAAMAGECIGIIKVVTEFIDGQRFRSYGNSDRRYSCRSGNVIYSAQRVVSAQANTIADVVNTLCDGR